MENLQLITETKVLINHIKENYIPDKPLVVWVDLFCGAGGTSTGIHLSDTDNVFVAACVNHNKNAIKSHAENHPFTIHLTEDIRDFEVVEKLLYIVSKVRNEFPECKVKIWASLECTNFSRAKGGQSRDADSRTLAEHMFMYMALDPDSFWFENVTEFLDWGPLQEKVVYNDGNSYCPLKMLKLDKNKFEFLPIWAPIPERKGEYFNEWVKKLTALGYDYKFKILNAADYGSCQSRERLFLQFPKKGKRFAWPDPTHSKKGDEGVLFGLPKRRPVRDVLDLNDHGKSIFDRKKPLSDKTLDVISKGIIKSLKEEEFSFIHKYYGNGDNYSSLNESSGTVTTKDRFAIFTLILNQYRTGNTSSIDKSIGTLTTVPKNKVLNFILNPSHGGHTTSINTSSPTVIARQDKAPLYILKAIMNDLGIVDIKMRMLKIPELLQIQGFPKDYKLIGTQTEQKKYIGNAVDVYMAKALANADYGLELQMAA